jgi:type I site-specific restriction endonuclease
MLEKLNLPLANLNLSKTEGKIYVFCILRKKKLLLTPEEWVRQHLIHYLVFHKNVAQTKIGSEISISANQLQRRCDLIIFDDFMLPKVIIEVKAPSISLDEKVINQVIHYNNQLKVPFIGISNGIQHEIVKIDYEANKFEKLSDFDFF